MNRIERLLKTACHAVAVLDSDSRRNFRDSYAISLQETIRDQARVPLRRSFGAVINELDAPVIDDLLSILKRLRSGTKGSKDDFTQRIQLALQLTEMSVGKQKGLEPGHLLWIFHKHYNGIGPVVQIEQGVANQGGLQ